MKIFLIVAIVFFSVALANSQNTFTPETSFGVKLGGSISKVSFDPLIEQEYKSGILGGLVFRHISQKSLGIQIELNYLEAGWSENLEPPNEYSRRLNYIQLPFMSHFNIGGGKTRLFFNLGPYVSYLLSDSEKVNLISEEEIKEHYGKDLNAQLEYGICGGMGFSRYFSFGIFQIEGRVNQSLINIFKSNSEPFDGSLNQIGEISVSYLFDFRDEKK